MHLAESNNLFSEVFDRASDKIDSIVYYQKSIMDVSAMPKGDFRVLGIMSSNIKIDLRVARICEYCSRNTLLTFIKCFQNTIVNIIVYEDNTSIGLSN